MDEYSIIAYINDELSEEEMGAFEQWLSRSKKNQVLFNRIKYIWDKSGFDKELIIIDKERSWRKLKSRIISERKDKNFRFSKSSRNIVRVAASIIILATLTIILKTIVVMLFPIILYLMRFFESREIDKITQLTMKVLRRLKRSKKVYRKETGKI